MTVLYPVVDLTVEPDLLEARRVVDPLRWRTSCGTSLTRWVRRWPTPRPTNPDSA